MAMSKHQLFSPARINSHTIFVIVAVFLLGASMLGQSTRSKTAGSAQKTPISMKKARKIALAKVPGKGEVKSSELETENGALRYSFDIQTPDGMYEIGVDAATGAIVENKKESPVDEFKERVRDAKGASAKAYHLLTKFPLGGEGGWDYVTVDSGPGRLYISRGTRVMVVDASNGNKIGEISSTEGVHGIALVPALRRGFTSNGRANTVTIFDLNTLQTISQVKAGTNPDAIIFDDASRMVFAFNGRSSDATVIDAASGAVAATIPLGGKPEFAATDGLGQVFVNIEDKNEIAVIDSRALKVKARWPLGKCEEPSGLAIDRKNRRLFSGCSNKVMAILDSNNGHIVDTLPIGQGVDATAFDPDLGLAFSSNGEGTITVVAEENPDKFSVAATIPTQRSARTMGLDTATHKIYLPAASFGPMPAPDPAKPRQRPPMLPDSFVVLVVGK